ncbi:MAG TPA: hypothetical protein VKK79_09590 [Candidatus Lokiarchaeia archaeon]|nr:hypothetical protein [Candidatus Lokiarchaeia archaeon]
MCEISPAEGSGLFTFEETPVFCEKVRMQLGGNIWNWDAETLNRARLPDFPAGWRTNIHGIADLLNAGYHVVIDSKALKGPFSAGLTRAILLLLERSKPKSNPAAIPPVVAGSEQTAILPAEPHKMPKADPRPRISLDAYLARARAQQGHLASTAPKGGVSSP